LDQVADQVAETRPKKSKVKSTKVVKTTNKVEVIDRGVDRKADTGSKPSSKPNPKPFSEKRSKPASNITINIAKARADPRVKNELVKSLKKAGLSDIFGYKRSSDFEDSDWDTKSNTSSATNRSTDSLGKHKRSVCWPQQVLGDKYTDFSERTLKHSQLDIRVFNIGELEVISDPEIDQEERIARTSLLKELNHFAGLYEWRAVLKLHSTVLKEIEKGKRSWSDPIDSLIQQILMPYRLPAVVTSAPKQPSKLWYCGDYNNQGCELDDKHTININGKACQARHICAKCWITDKQRNYHSRMSDECPHFEESYAWS